MGTTGSTSAARAFAFERALVRVRWFGVALGAALIGAYAPNPGVTVPPSALPLSAAGVAVLAVVNLVLIRVLRRGSGPHLRRVGLAVFGADLGAVWIIIWAFTFDPFDNSWVVLTVLAVEGALRYELRGALSVAAIGLGLESARQVFMATAFPDREWMTPLYAITAVAYRVGIVVMIGMIAGQMARNLERARAAAEAQARENERIAAREVEARRESTAFQRVILAGVAGTALDETLHGMIEAIGSELGYERIAVLMRRGEVIAPVAIHGFDQRVLAMTVGTGDGIAGWVFEHAQTRVLPDVTRDPDYLSVEPTTRSQVTIPISIEGEVLGALDVESPVLDRFRPDDVERLERLTGQMALVIQNARLLEAERAMVERLQELDVLKSDFIAIASHELRTPLTAMHGSIKTLQRSDLAPEMAEQLLAILDRQAERLARIVEDLLITSRVASGHVRLQMTSTDVATIVRAALDQFGERAARVSVAIADAVPRIVTDEQRVVQIVRNLVENALKFSPPDAPVRLTAQIAREGLLLEVTDEGPGIPPDERESIFERFHQVGGSLRRGADGLGLGLFITARLVEALGGSITVQSSTGRGSTFRVTLPLATADSRGETA